MGDVFLSYSRKDTDFVRRLHDALVADGREVWVDWQGIPPSDEWMATIRAAIDQAEAAVFVLSPDAAASEVVGHELAHAVERKKRLIPVVWREPGAEVPEALARLNWIFAREADDFDAAVAALRQALDTDLDWVRAHTRLTVRAVEWQGGGDTLRGAELSAFEDWVAGATDKEPQPTALQSEYLLASRRAQTRRQRIAWASIAGGLVVAAILGTVAWFQNEERGRQEQIVEARRLLSKAEALRDVPDLESDAYSSHSDSLRAAISALATLDRVGEPTIDAVVALRKGRARLRNWIRVKPENIAITGAAFDAAARFVGLVQRKHLITVWDIQERRQVARCERAPDVNRPVWKASVSADGSRAAVYVETINAGDPASLVVVYGLPDCAELLTVEVPQTGRDAVKWLALTPDGRRLAILSVNGLDVWQVDDGSVRPVQGGTDVSYASMSRDGRHIAIYASFDVDGARQRRVSVLDLDDLKIVAETATERPARFVGWAGDSVFATRQRFAFTGRELVARPAPDIGARRAAYSPDARRYAVVIAGRLPGETTPIATVEVLDTVTDELVATHRRQGVLEAVTFSADGDSVVSIDSQAVEIGIWRFADTEATASLSAGTVLTGLDFSATGDTLVAGTGDAPRAWRLPPPGTPGGPVPTDAATGPPMALAPLPHADGAILSEAAGPGGLQARIVQGDISRGGWYRSLELWRDGAKTAETTLEPMLDRDREAVLTFAGGGRYLITGGRAGLDIRDTATLEVAATLYHSDAVLGGIQSDGRRAASMGRDLDVRIWDIATGAEVTRVIAARPARALALSNDGRWLAALSGEGEIDLYALAASDLIAQACRWLEPPCP